MLRRVFIGITLVAFCASAATSQTGQSMYVYQNNFWLSLRCTTSFAMHDKAYNVRCLSLSGFRTM